MIREALKVSGVKRRALVRHTWALEDAGDASNAAPYERSGGVNDMQPRPRIRDGSVRGLESWTPRFTIDGPVVKGKVNILQSVEYGYSQPPVYSLPPFERDTKEESFESYSRVDVNVSPTDQFSGSAVVAPRKTTYAGLGHAKVDTTLNVYTQVLEASVRDAAEKVGSELVTIDHETGVAGAVNPTEA